MQPHQSLTAIPDITGVHFKACEPPCFGPQGLQRIGWRGFYLVHPELILGEQGKSAGEWHHGLRTDGGGHLQEVVQHGLLLHPRVNPFCGIFELVALRVGSRGPKR